MRKDRGEIDPNSNFRQFYQNDNQFYEVVIKKEEPPYDFKIQIFLDKRGDKVDAPQPRDLILKVMDKLTDLGATKIQDRILKERSDDPKKSDKIRIDFTINNTE